MKICSFGFEANAVFLQIRQQKPVKPQLPAKARLDTTTQLGTVIARHDRHASEHGPRITNKRVDVSLLVCTLLSTGLAMSILKNTWYPYNPVVLMK